MYYQQCMMLNIIIYILIFFIRFILLVGFHRKDSAAKYTGGSESKGIPAYVWFNLGED